jgi:Tfp pilus assembly protein PilO
MRIKQITKRLISMIGGTLFVVGAIAMYSLFIQPADEETQFMKADLINQESILEIQQSAIAQVEKLIKEYEGGGNLQDTISEALPFSPELASVLAQIGGISRINGIVLHSVRFSVSGNQNIAVEESSAIGSNLIRPVGSVNIEASLEGGYEDLKKFIATLENNL